jgi:hypothetical protein
MSEQYEEQNHDSSGQDQTEGGAGGGEGGGEENNEADMIFAPEASKPGRNAGMLMIAFVMIGVGVIYFMRARGGPAKVSASAEVTQADTLIKGFDGTQVKKMHELLKSTEKVVDIMNQDRSKSMPDTKVEVNPFKFVSPTQPTNNSDPGAGDKAKARARQKFLDGLGNLKVQYLMVSAFAKTAMINNRLVQEGQEVEGFTIDKITPTLVNVSRTIDGYEFKAEIKTTKDMK